MATMQINFPKKLRRLVSLVICLGTLCAPASAEAVAPLQLDEVVGVGMLRGIEVGGMSRARSGDTLPPAGVAVATGADSRVEVLTLDGGRWRIGSLALWIPLPDGGGRLLSGTALVEVPTDRERAVDSTTGRALLGTGLWIVQATHNEGLKLICLDGPAKAVAGGGTTPAGDTPARLTLQPGQVVFLRPGGLEFGPAVTIFLQELLVTSRLVNGFDKPLPQARRLQVLAQAQNERLKRVTNAFVAGARDDDGFQLMIPQARQPAQKRTR